MRFVKPFVVIGALAGMLGAVGIAFLFTPLYLDLQISMRGNEGKNEYVILLSDRSERNGIWALDLPKERYTEKIRPGSSEIFAGWFAGKPIRMPTYDETDINLDVGDFSFISAVEFETHKQDRNYWKSKLVNLRLQGENWQYDRPLWYRPEEIANLFEPASTSPSGATAYKIKPDAAAKMRNEIIGCTLNKADCKDLFDDTWFLALHGSNGSIDGVVSCANIRNAIVNRRNGSPCSGEFVFPNRRHVWFDAPYIEKENVRDFYDRVWIKLKELTVYDN
jgi:hypothetical protein